MKTLTNNIIQFELPTQLACPQPTEQRNIERDEVRLLITNDSGQVYHDTFRNLDAYLEPGDVLVVNTSATVQSALPIRLPNGQPGMLHLSTQINDSKWLVELRAIQGEKTIRWKEGEAGMVLSLPGGAMIILEKKFYKDHNFLDLWVASFRTNQPLDAYMMEYGQPIKYVKPDKPYPLSYYQTVFAFHPGSAEMPSAGRGFTNSLLQRLNSHGVVFAPILLHTGVSSLEEGEKPYSEYFEIDPISAATLNTAKAEGRRIIAVGTTAIRAIESAVNNEGIVEPFKGHTELYIQEDYQMRIADGLITGFHEPRASHLHMLQSLAGASHIDQAYREAIKENYYWHEFGDLHLILK